MKFLKQIVICLTIFEVSIGLQVFGGNKKDRKEYDYKSIVKTWDLEDMKDFLSDHNVVYNQQSSADEIKDKFNEQWEKIVNYYNENYENSNVNDYDTKNLKQKFLKSPTGDKINKNLNSDSNFNLHWNLFSPSNKEEEFKSWFFKSWSKDDLYNFLTKNGIEVSNTVRDSKDELAKMVEDNFDEIAKKSKKSGKYAGLWIFSYWNESSLKQWLDENKISYDESLSRDELIKNVRDNIYDVSRGVSNKAEEGRRGIWNTLENQKDTIYKTSEDIKKDFFDLWSKDDIYKWLSENGLIDGGKEIQRNKDQLIEVALKNKDKLFGDWSKWNNWKGGLDKSKTKSENLINDTFLVGVENWPKDRLKLYLKSRGVSYGAFTRRKELVKLVEENKFKPVKFSNWGKDSVSGNEWIFEGWSVDNLKKFLKENKQSTEGTFKEVLDRSVNLYHDLLSKNEELKKTINEEVGAKQEQIKKTGESFWTQIKYYFPFSYFSGAKTTPTNRESSWNDYFDFKTWEESDLVNYLSSFGYKLTEDKKDTSGVGTEVNKKINQIKYYWNGNDNNGVGNERGYSREELVELARKNTDYYLGTNLSKRPESKIANLANQIQSRAYSLYRGTGSYLQNLWR
ncbi:double-strand break repair enhancer MSC1 ASCRUDRAFT_138540 [Ascoidea rubescens DSM 1968]|uniref:Meiotic sister chromatid recombination protein 1 n=1 Tax=Ascoidea rubescens DSM 1968 TaxID=1344418 RepID=A0A1D2VJR2_9ASCO|nr:hypothetical protein ASCRUDRAFT_138540 [Ascoidea rubescens DSM 1968]ODV61838.1 hypothetical protein ASCRUDRAFT_138540 [Ascoidea rubescens DSM 1968]